MAGGQATLDEQKEERTSTDLLYPVSDEKSTCLQAPLKTFLLLLTPSVSSDNCLASSNGSLGSQ